MGEGEDILAGGARGEPLPAGPDPLPESDAFFVKKVEGSDWERGGGGAM